MTPVSVRPGRRAELLAGCAVVLLARVCGVVLGAGLLTAALAAPL